MAKDVIYLEVDDEITAVIDKLQDSPQAVVALVLPKRATVFQSVVNMKLLKKTSEKSKKSVVLITSDETVFGIAGVARIHVAKTLQSKPLLPPTPKKAAAETTVELEGSKEPTKLGDEPTESASDAIALDEVIELDNTGDSADPTPIRVKPNRKLKIPDFNSFRLRFFLIISLVVVLIVGWFFAYVILPKATITVKTNQKLVEASLNLTANTATTEFDPATGVVPAVMVETSQTDSEKVTATGEKNSGAQATGTVVLFNCSKDDKLSDTNRTVPAGTTISGGGLNYVIATETVVQPSSFAGNTCQYNKPSTAVTVTAAEGGKKYNVSGRTYTVAGFSTIIADNDAGMSGGTDVITKVISAADVETAKTRMAGRQKELAAAELRAQLLAQNMFALAETIDEGAPALTASPEVGKEAAEVTVTAVTKFTMLGVLQTSIDELLSIAIKLVVSDDQQNIQNNGLETAIFTVAEKKSPTEQKLSLKTSAVIGPNIDKATIAANAAGKKTGDIRDSIESIEGVEEVTIKYSPFWVFQTPKASKKITVILEQASQ